MEKKPIVLISLYDLDSLSVRSLHGILKRENFDVHSIFFKSQNSDNTMDYPTDTDYEKLLELVQSIDPVFVGLSVRSTLYEIADKITKKIKNRINTQVIWGGIHATIRPEQCISSADAVCVGEGDSVIIDLARAFTTGEPIDGIQNMWVNKDGTVIKNQLRPLIQDLDILPFPDFTNENKHYINDGQILSSLPGIIEYRPIYWMMTSRGCLFRCSYCCNNTLKTIFKGHGKYLRRRSPESVLKELIHMKQHIFKEMEFVVFVDDIFVYDLDWLRKFCREYKKEINLPFCCFFHPKVIKEELVVILKEAGIDFMTAGIQSGSEYIRQTYFNRFEKNTDIIKATQIIQKYEVGCAYNLILDNPVETDHHRYESLKLLVQMPKPYELHPTTLTHFPETQLTKLLLEKGLIAPTEVEDIKQKSFERWSLVLDTMRSDEELWWDMLYFLANKFLIPGRLVLLMGRMKFLKPFTRPMAMVLRDFSPYLKTGTQSQRLLDITTQQVVQNTAPNTKVDRLINLFKRLKQQKNVWNLFKNLYVSMRLINRRYFSNKA